MILSPFQINARRIIPREVLAVAGDPNTVSPAPSIGANALAPRYPLIASNPITVVNGQSWRVGANDATAVEILGVGGSWVEQGAITNSLWYWDGFSWVTEDQIPVELTASGTGAGVLTVRLNSTEANAVSLSGGGRFYSDSAGTSGETTSVTLAAGVATTLYVKLASGTSRMYIQKGSKISEWGSGGSAFSPTTNSPRVTKFDTRYIHVDVLVLRFDSSDIIITGQTYPWVNATFIWFVGSQLTVSGQTYAWNNATFIFFEGSLQQITYVSKEWRATLSGLQISSSTMTSSMVDQVLIDIDASGTTAIGDKAINLAGLCGAATAASAAARTSLASKTFTVTVNL